MNMVLVTLLADAVHHWEADTPAEEKRIDVAEAKEILRNIARMLNDDVLRENLAIRLVEHYGGLQDMHQVNVNDVLDALIDELMEDKEVPDGDEPVTGPACAWCGRELLALTGLGWITAEDGHRCTMSPDGIHLPN